MYRKTELRYLPINHQNWLIQYQDLVLPNPICMPLCHVCFSLATFSCSCNCVAYLCHCLRERVRRRYIYYTTVTNVLKAQNTLVVLFRL